MAGRRLRLRDILRGGERDVVEISGSRGPQPGDILFARVVSFEGTNLMIGAGSMIIPPTRKSSLLQLRRSLRETVGAIDAGVLREIRDELREHYLQIRELVLNPPPPVMLNTDGDPMEFHEITYEVESTDAAFRTLSSGDVPFSVESQRWRPLNPMPFS